MDPVVAILADMVRSALAWEQEHGVQQNGNKTEPSKALTTVRPAYTVEIHKNADKGENNDHQD
jgi:hypothetical protein